MSDAPDDSTGRPSRRWRGIRLAFGVLGVTFGALALRGTWNEVQSDVSWSVTAIAVGLTLVILTTMAAARLWAAVNPRIARSKSRSNYYAAIVGKYIPGGVFQFVGQVGYTTAEGATVVGAAGAYLLSVVITVGAGLIASGMAAFETSFPVWLRVGAAVGVVGGIGLSRGANLETATGFVLRVTKKPGRVNIPKQQLLNESVAWGVLGLGTLAASYAVVASQVTGGTSKLTMAAAFVVAWLVGFLAVPFPAGIGIREAVLVWLLAPMMPTASVVAASLVHRLMIIAGEVIVYLVSRMWGRFRA